MYILYFLIASVLFCLLNFELRIRMLVSQHLPLLRFHKYFLPKLKMRSTENIKMPSFQFKLFGKRQFNKSINVIVYYNWKSWTGRWTKVKWFLFRKVQLALGPWKPIAQGVRLSGMSARVLLPVWPQLPYLVASSEGYSFTRKTDWAISWVIYRQDSRYKRTGRALNSPYNIIKPI